MEQRNVIIAAVLAALIIFGYPYLLQLLGVEVSPPPQQTEVNAPAENAPPANAPAPPQTVAPEFVDRATAVAQSPRVKIDSPRVAGSIALKGGRIDDVVLKDYRTTVDKNSPNIVLLSPAGTKDAYYADFGWLAGSGLAVPASQPKSA